MNFSMALVLVSLSFLSSAQESGPCPPPGIDTVDGFDLNLFISARWYVHEQTATVNTPIENFYCSYAEYALKPEPSDFGYTVDVKNYAQDASGNEFGGPLCAAQVGSAGTDASKLAVAPCFIPLAAAGPYWVVYYDEDDGVAIVSGGAPDEVGAGGACKTEDRNGDAGLWIFLRSADRDEDKIGDAKAFLDSLHYDLTVLNTVEQSGCLYDDGPAGGIQCKDSTEELHFFWSTYTCDTLPWFGCWCWAQECPETCHAQCEG